MMMEAWPWGGTGTLECSVWKQNWPPGQGEVEVVSRGLPRFYCVLRTLSLERGVQQELGALKVGVFAFDREDKQAVDIQV